MREKAMANMMDEASLRAKPSMGNGIMNMKRTPAPRIMAMEPFLLLEESSARPVTIMADAVRRKNSTVKALWIRPELEVKTPTRMRERPPSMRREEPSLGALLPWSRFGMPLPNTIMSMPAAIRELLKKYPDGYWVPRSLSVAWLQENHPAVRMATEKRASIRIGAAIPHIPETLSLIAEFMSY